MIFIWVKSSCYSAVTTGTAFWLLMTRCLFCAKSMMTSSNGNIFRFTGHLCGEFTGSRGIPRTKASEAELWCVLWSASNKRLNKQSWGWWFETPSWSLWRHCNDELYLQLGYIAVAYIAEEHYIREFFTDNDVTKDISRHVLILRFLICVSYMLIHHSKMARCEFTFDQAVYRSRHQGRPVCIIPSMHYSSCYQN